ncbi:MAG: NADH-quinone oxidoreductase subunit NuoH [Nitrospirae bacterium]|nr:NADH-quinone oxidoreductase subunit NuoH [Nitrospirota bacterium]
MVFTLLNTAYLTYYERKVMAHMQQRLGPMHTGYHGLLQPLADGLKLFFKEDIIPSQADKAVFILAPLMGLIPAFISFAVVPFGPKFTVMGHEVPLYLADLNISLLYVLALSSMGAYGIIMAGWSSNSKYALMGGLRSSSQVISYEIAMGLSLISVLMMSGSLSLVDITKAQAGAGLLRILPNWNVFCQPVAFIIYLIASIAETNRAPFDLPEAENELVAGFHVEYSGMRFAYFFMAEYANMLMVSCLAVVLFLGGWNPIIPRSVFEMVPGLGGYIGFIGDPAVWWFIIKLYAYFFLFLWFRATLPRLRYDQLMKLGWKIMLPVALVNILVTGIVMTFLN